MEIKFNDDIIMPITVEANGAVNSALAYDTYGVTPGSYSDNGSETFSTDKKGYTKYSLVDFGEICSKLATVSEKGIIRLKRRGKAKKTPKKITLNKRSVSIKKERHSG